MKISGILTLLFLFAGACGIQDGRPSGVFIRVQNNSDVSYENLTVQSGNAEQFFGDIPSRAFSDYQQFEYAFRYGAILLEAEGMEFSFVPTDYSEQKPLKNGYYTYRVGLTSANLTDASLTLTLIQE